MKKSPTDLKLDNILKFIQKAEKLKSLMRHSWLSTGRRESVAEHSWRVTLLTMVLAPQMETKIDVGRVVMMLTIHDLAEIEAGDHHAWRGKLKNKTALERAGLKKLVENLPPIQQKEIFSLWEEYEARKTPEGKFAKAVDKLETIDQHNLADIKTWNKIEKTYNLVHGSEEVKYSKTLKALKGLIDKQSRAKITKK